MKDKRIIYGLAAVVVVIAIAAIVWFQVKQSPSSALALASGAMKIEIKPSDRVRGKADAPLTIIEYASMTCPHCAEFERVTMPKLVADYVDTGKAKIIFREFPLDGAARMASSLARCVPEDNFYSFIDLLFLNQDKWIQDFDGNGQITREDVVEGMARMGRFAGLDRPKVEACVDDKANLAIVDANWQEAQTKYGVDSTPTFFVNGEVHKGEWPYEQLDAYLKKKLAGK